MVGHSHILILFEERHMIICIVFFWWYVDFFSGFGLIQNIIMSCGILAMLSKISIANFVVFPHLMKSNGHQGQLKIL